MPEIGAWVVSEEGAPERLVPDRDFLEKHLENWIQDDPTLLSPDIRWVCRQLHLPDRSILDLLGLTKDGTWVIAELKAGSVDAGTVRQAFHYFIELAMLDNGQLVRLVRDHPIRDRDGNSAVDPSVGADLDVLAEDPEDRQRDYMLLAAGVGSGESAELAAEVLAEHMFNVPVRVVTFQCLRGQSGQRLLVRNVEEDERHRDAGAALSSAGDLEERARRFGVWSELEQIRSGLLQRGYRTVQRKYGLNFNQGTRLQTFWATPREGMIHIGYLDSNFETLYNLDQEWVAEHMGENWIDLPPAQARDRVLTWADTIHAHTEAAAAAPELVDES